MPPWGQGWPKIQVVDTNQSLPGGLQKFVWAPVESGERTKYFFMMAKEPFLLSIRADQVGEDALGTHVAPAPDECLWVE